MVQWVKISAAKPGNLSLISNTHKVERTNSHKLLPHKHVLGLTPEPPQLFLADINTTSYYWYCLLCTFLSVNCHPRPFIVSWNLYCCRDYPSGSHPEGFLSTFTAQFSTQTTGISHNPPPPPKPDTRYYWSTKLMSFIPGHSFVVDRVSLCCPGWPGFTCLCHLVLGLKVCITMSGHQLNSWWWSAILHNCLRLVSNPGLRPLARVSGLSRVAQQ